MIENAGSWWRFWSVRFGALAGVLAGAAGIINGLPAATQAALPGWLVQALIALSAFSAAVLVPLARVIQQPNANPDDNEGG